MVLALCLSIGPHWVVFQSVAWGAMVVEYARQVPFSAALAEAFDGDHPCDLCKNISAVRNSEKKNDSRPAATIKLDLICATRLLVLLPRFVEFDFSRVRIDATALTESPPTPPPRSALS